MGRFCLSSGFARRRCQDRDKMVVGWAATMLLKWWYLMANSERTCNSLKYVDSLGTLPKTNTHQQDQVQSAWGCCRTIAAGVHGSTPHILKTLVRNDKKFQKM